MAKDHRTVGRSAPGPSGLPVLGSLWQVGGDMLGFLTGLETRYGPVVRVRIGPQGYYHLISDPDLAEQVLWRRSDRYTRSTPANAKLTAITGSSLITTTGPGWLERRRLIAPFFTRERMLAERPVMLEQGSRQVGRWAEDAGRGAAVDATASLMATTCAIASQVLFGVEIDDPEIGPALTAVLQHHWKRLLDPLDLLHRLPTRSRRAFDAANRRVAEVITQVAATAGDGTLLGALRTVDGGIPDFSVADELVTLLIAGHETTANALGWALHLLAEHPHWQEQVRAEAAGAQLATAELPLATRVFQEALRLYPPIWLIDRQALADDELGGFHIAAGTNVIVAPWVLHRSARFWDRPLDFAPDRFLSKPPKNVYIPFGIGPHACIGTHLAMIEGPLLLALIARRWRWRRAPRTTVVAQPGLTLRMRKPLRLLIEPV